MSHLMKLLLILTLVLGYLEAVSVRQLIEDDLKKGQEKDTLGKRHTPDSLGTGLEKDTFEKTGCFKSKYSRKGDSRTKNTGSVAVIHRYMNYVYATTISYYNVDEKVDQGPSSQIIGFSPRLAHSKTIGRHVALMDFEVKPNSLEETPYNSVSSHIMLFKNGAQGAASEPRHIQVSIVLSDGINKSFVEHREWDNGSDFIAIDISSVFITFEDNACPGLRVSLQLFTVNGKQTPTELDPFKYLMFYPQSTGPLIVKYMNIDASVFKDFTLASASSAFVQKMEKRRKPRSPADNLCSLRPYSFNVQDMHWARKHLYYPRKYDLNYCAGECPTLAIGIHSVLYTSIKELYHMSTGYTSELPKTCCVPHSFYRMSFLYYSPEIASTYVDNIANAMVKSCRCV